MTSGFAAWIFGRCAENSGLPSGYGVLPRTVPPSLGAAAPHTALFCLPNAWSAETIHLFLPSSLMPKLAMARLVIVGFSASWNVSGLVSGLALISSDWLTEM